MKKIFKQILASTKHQEEKFAAEYAARRACTCEYLSVGAAALHASFHGIDVPLPKIRDAKCPVHGDKVAHETI